MTNLVSSVNNFSGEKDFIKWEPRFALGITYIDEQHKHLVELCNELYTKIMESRAKYGNNENSQWQSALAGTLKECVTYVATHFSDEEKLMQLAAYEGYPSHKQRHEEFTKKVLETARQFNSMTFTDAIKFCKFLYEWILSHIAHEDKLYVNPIIEYKKAQGKAK
ncbi:MAG: bacteriohemerythrin [Treponema sp.]|nr:bacteriohemerythrin [Treponema sp.]